MTTYTSQESLLAADLFRLATGLTDSEKSKISAALDQLAALLRAREEAKPVAWVADLAPGIERMKYYMGVYTPHKEYAEKLATDASYVITPLFDHPPTDSAEAKDVITGINDAVLLRSLCEDIADLHPTVRNQLLAIASRIETGSLIGITRCRNCGEKSEVTIHGPAMSAESREGSHE